MPTVDLGYERHQAIRYEPEGKFYNFSNIRYAEPPVGKLRFKAPKKPTGKSNKINRGTVGKICPQSSGSWYDIAADFVPSYFLGEKFNFTKAEMNLPPHPKAGEDGRETEDCLFLDVYVPKPVWDSGSPDAPVLVWIHGGGFTGGEKTGSGQWDPTGLLSVASRPFITVTLNYRLGAFGWLGGPEFEKQGGLPNAGLHDQRLALEWVADNIHMFGGDNKRITVIGESAGGSSIEHQITAYGGKGDLPFQQAIPQSRAFLPSTDGDSLDASYASFLDHAGVNSFADLQKTSTDKLKRANDVTSYNSPYGSNGYGPTVDGKFVPKLPGQLFAEGKFFKDVKVMSSHVGMEGLAFTSPNVTTQGGYKQVIRQSLPDISKKELQFVENKLYPAKDYKNEFERAVAVTTDLGFICNNYYIATAFKNQTYNYEFNVFPAIHGADNAYTWYVPGSNTSGGLLGGIDKKVATTIQGYVTSFLIDGKPVAKGEPDLPRYGDEGKLVKLTGSAVIVIAKDPANSDACRWWQKGLFAD
jgi:carboxylesterase type B